MIIANIKDAERYYALDENFKKAFEFLKTLDENSQTGPFDFGEFKGNIIIFDNLKENSAKKEKVLEAHKDYIDIHYVVDGSESIGYADTDTLEISEEYDSEKDFMLLKGDMYNIYLDKGDFCIVYPEDAHAPVMYAHDDKLTKAIVKIKLNR